MQKNRNIEKIAFKVVQMKSLEMHITNQKLSFDIFTVGNVQNLFIEHDLYLYWFLAQHFFFFNFDPYNGYIVGYCYKYTRATYDWFCAPGSHIVWTNSNVNLNI